MTRETDDNSLPKQFDCTVFSEALGVGEIQIVCKLYIYTVHVHVNTRGGRVSMQLQSIFKAKDLEASARRHQRNIRDLHLYAWRNSDDLYMPKEEININTYTVPLSQSPRVCR